MLLSLIGVGLTLLTACATTQRISAAGDVHTLLVSIRDNDRAAFDAHVDRRALEARLQASLIDHARDPRLGDAGAALGMLLSGPLSRAAGGVLLQPDVFRAAADYYGYNPATKIPGVLALATVLTPLPDGRVCAKDRARGSCLLTFADEDGTWKLVDFDANRVLAGRRGGHRP